MCEDITDDDIDFYLANMHLADRAYFLVGAPPSSGVSVCCWCHRRYEHSSLCVEAAYDVERKWRYGRYRGRRLLEVPASYLELFLRGTWGAIDLELAAMRVVDRVRWVSKLTAFWYRPRLLGDKVVHRRYDWVVADADDGEVHHEHVQ
jgi:hypothetical protein